MNYVKSHNAILLIKKSGTYRPLACVEEVVLAKHTALLPTVAANDVSGWVSMASDKKGGWTATLRGVALLATADAKWATDELYALLNGYTLSDVQLMLSDGAGGSWYVGGRARTTGITTQGNASDGSPATWELELTGAGNDAAPITETQWLWASNADMNWSSNIIIYLANG